MAKDAYDEYMDSVDKKGTSGSYGKERQQMPSMELPRPRIFNLFTAPPAPAPKVPSKAPAGMDAAVKGDIGMYRQMEAGKQKGMGGKSISNPLKYRTPETGIDSKFGPGDKVC